MKDTLQKPTDSRWRRTWHRYAEFLRKNGRRPELVHFKEKSLYTWYNNNLSKSDNGLLNQDQELSFSKLTDNGETYKFYVANKEKNLSKLASFGRVTNLIGKEIDGRDSTNFAEACKIYVDFCNCMERHPWLDIKEELDIAKWYLKAKDVFFNSRFTDQDMRAFDQLLQTTKQYQNDNVINHVNELPDGKLDEEERNEVMNADEGSEFHMGAWERNWYETRDRYSKYLDDNKKVPTENSDRQLYHWLYRQKKLLSIGGLDDGRKDELKKLLAKIEVVRKYQVDEANKGNEEIILDRKHGPKGDCPWRADAAT